MTDLVVARAICESLPRGQPVDVELVKRRVYKGLGPERPAVDVWEVRVTYREPDSDRTALARMFEDRDVAVAYFAARAAAFDMAVGR